MYEQVIEIIISMRALTDAIEKLLFANTSENLQILKRLVLPASSVIDLETEYVGELL